MPTYKIYGAHAETGEDTYTVVTADSPKEAEAFASIRKIMVGRVVEMAEVVKEPGGDPIRPLLLGMPELLRDAISIALAALCGLAAIVAFALVLVALGWDQMPLVRAIGFAAFLGCFEVARRWLRKYLNLTREGEA